MGGSNDTESKSQTWLEQYVFSPYSLELNQTNALIALLIIEITVYLTVFVMLILLAYNLLIKYKHTGENHLSLFYLFSTLLVSFRTTDFFLQLTYWIQQH